MKFLTRKCTTTALYFECKLEFVTSDPASVRKLRYSYIIIKLERDLPFISNSEDILGESFLIRGFVCMIVQVECIGS